MLILKLALFCIPIAFLFMPGGKSAIAPAATALAGLALWYMEQKDAPRLAVWGATVLAIIVAMFKGADAVLLASALPLGALAAIELYTRQRQLAAPPGIAILGAGIFCGIVAAYFWKGGGTGVRALGDVSRVVVIGDSLTSGVPGDEVARRWPDILAEKLGGEVVNLSYPGDSVGDSWNRWQDRVARKEWSTRPGWEPDLFVIVLGGNNILRNADRRSTEAEMRQWVDGLSPNGKKILIVAVPGRPFGTNYDGMWQSIAASNDNVEYMRDDALRYILTTPVMTLPDRIHFNQQANDYFAEQVYRRIRGQ